MQQWFDLAPTEQEFWLAYDTNRDERISDLMALLVEKKVLTGEALAIIRLLGDLV